jgi:hypothetical protein
MPTAPYMARELSYERGESFHREPNDMRKKRTEFFKIQPLGLTKDAAAQAVGGRNILRMLVDAGELEPFFRRRNFVLFDSTDVTRAFTRFRNGQTKIPLTLEGQPNNPHGENV